MVWRNGRLPGQERVGPGIVLVGRAEGWGEDEQAEAVMGVCWLLQGPSSLRTPPLPLTNLPSSLGSVKKIDYFPLQLTSGPGSHH